MKDLSPIRARVFVPILLIFAAVAGFSSCAPPPENDQTVYQTYVPPAWAPPYDGISQIRYYYFPDYDMFYDVEDGVFCYQTGDAWICSATLPPMFAAVDLDGAFIVLIHHDLVQPWLHHAYFERNYPSHCYDQYGAIVERNRIVPNLPRERRVVPRAFNENTNRVTFMQQPTGREMPPNPPPAPPKNPNQREPAPNPARPAPAPASPHYDRVAQEVPMRSITPSMPAASKSFNYGSGYSKPPSAQVSQPPSAQPSRQPSQQPSHQPASRK